MAKKRALSRTSGRTSNIDPSTDTVDIKINVSGPNKILWRTDSGEGGHQEGTIGGLTAETTPAAGDFILAEVSGELRKIDIDDLPNGTLPYAYYVANINQSSGTADPTATIIANNLSGDPVWARVSSGVYSCTLSGAFTAGQTVVLPSTMLGYYNPSIPFTIICYRQDSNTLILECNDGVDFFDNGVSDVLVSVMVYNGGVADIGITLSQIKKIARKMAFLGS